MSGRSVGEAGRARRIGPEARREARGFGDYLEAARRTARRQVAEGAARRAAGGAEAPGAEAGASAGAALSRRRDRADGLDDGLALRRSRLGGEERGDERRAEAAPSRGRAPAGGAAPEAPGTAPGAGDLAAAVEKLAVTVERRDRALGPELRLDLGGRLSVRLARGEMGMEVVFVGGATMARLVEAELPAVLARLRQRGIAVSRAEVRLAREEAPAGGAAAAPGKAAPVRRS